MEMTIDEHIEVLKSYHYGFTGCAGNLQDSIDVAVDSMRKCQRIAKAIDKVEEYICDVETDTVKAQGMAQALDIFEQVLGEVEDGKVGAEESQPEVLYNKALAGIRNYAKSKEGEENGIHEN